MYYHVLYEYEGDSAGHRRAATPRRANRVDKALLSEKRAMRALYLGLAALVTPAHALGKPDITFILGAPHLPCLSLI